MSKTVRERRTGWELQHAVYELKDAALPGGASCWVGTSYPKAHAASYVVRLNLKKPLDHREARKLMRAIYRGIVENVEQNKGYDAALTLGGGDHPNMLPVTRAGQKEVYCFWVLLGPRDNEVMTKARPVLAIRSHYNRKDVLREFFNKEWQRSEAGSGREVETTKVSSGWWPEGKLWWCLDEHAYPRLLGRMRKAGWVLVWVERAGMPPPPPIEELP
jgi:hypothetical protein